MLWCLWNLSELWTTSWMLTYESCMHLLKIWAHKTNLFNRLNSAPQHWPRSSTQLGGGGVFVAAPPFSAAESWAHLVPQRPTWAGAACIHPSHSSLLVSQHAGTVTTVCLIFPFTIPGSQTIGTYPVYFYREENGGIAGFCNWATLTRLALSARAWIWTLNYLF